MPVRVEDIERHADSDRLNDEFRTYAAAQRYELTDNAHKGDPMCIEGTDLARSAPDVLGDLLYHVNKLGLAMKLRDRHAILEYAADVGNCAMFAAMQAEALDEQYLHPGPIEYDDEHAPIAKPGELGEFKRVSYAQAVDLLSG